MIEKNEIQIRDIESLGKRAMCTGVLLYRWSMEYYTRYHSGQSLTAENQAFLEWVKAAGILDLATKEEVEYLHAPFGSWSNNDLARLLWHAERLGVILWSLSVIETLPPIDTSLGVEVMSLLDCLPFYSDPGCLICKSEIRSIDEITSMEDLFSTYAFTLSMRKKDYSLSSIDGNVGETIRREAQAMWKTGKVPRLISNELPAFDKPLGSISKKQRAFLSVLLEQRIGAIYWATNQIENWDEIDLKW